MKKCSKCEVEKESIDFYKRIDSKDGLRGECKDCYNLYKREYKRNNQDKVNEYAREYYKENFEKVRENRQNNKEVSRLSQKRYYENNKETILKKAKDYYLIIKDSRDEDFHKKQWIKNKDKTTKRRNYRKLNDPLFKLSLTIINLLF